MNQHSSLEQKNAKCKDCDLAMYCYTDSSLWVFRTQEEMEKKVRFMESCHVRKLLMPDQDQGNEGKA